MNRSLRKSLSGNLFLAIGVSATENGWPKGLVCVCHRQFPAQKPIRGIWRDFRSLKAIVITNLSTCRHQVVAVDNEKSQGKALQPTAHPRRHHPRRRQYHQ